jgi:hypothetical protein
MFVKLFSSILTSSVWSEDNATRIVWITLLALADKDGDVRSSPSGLARMANVSVEECQRALALFLAPDPESGTPDDDGRRIERREGGWFILNYGKYRALQDLETRKAQWRDAAKKYRQRKSSEHHGASSSNHHESSHTEAEAEAEAERLDNDNNGVNPSKSGNVEKSPAIVEKFAAEDREVIDAVRRSVRIPAAFDGAVRGLIEGSGGPAFPVAIVGRAIAEMAAAGVPFRPASLRAFCRRLVDDAAADLTDGAENGARRGGKGVPAALDQWGRVVARLAAKDAAEAAERAARRERGEPEIPDPDYSEFETEGRR